MLLFYDMLVILSSVHIFSFEILYYLEYESCYWNLILATVGKKDRDGLLSGLLTVGRLFLGISSFARSVLTLVSKGLPLSCLGANTSGNHCMAQSGKWGRAELSASSCLTVLGWVVSIPKIHVHREPVNMTLFGNWVFEDVHNIRWYHAGLRWALSPTWLVSL